MSHYMSKTQIPTPPAYCPICERWVCVCPQKTQIPTPPAYCPICERWVCVCPKKRKSQLLSRTTLFAKGVTFMKILTKLSQYETETENHIIAYNQWVKRGVCNRRGLSLKNRWSTYAHYLVRGETFLRFLASNK